MNSFVGLGKSLKEIQLTSVRICVQASGRRKKPVQMPAAKHAMFGNEIVVTDYEPLEDPRQSLGASWIDIEIRCLERMLERMEEGNE